MCRSPFRWPVRRQGEDFEVTHLVYAKSGNRRTCLEGEAPGSTPALSSWTWASIMFLWQSGRRTSPLNAGTLPLLTGPVYDVIKDELRPRFDGFYTTDPFGNRLELLCASGA